MKKIFLFSLMISFILADSSAKALFDIYCKSCHITTKPVNKNSLKAPPIMGVMFHVKEVYPNKKEAIKFIVDYVKAPSFEKALCSSVKRFGLMPAINISDRKLKKIAKYIYENFPPKGFKHPQNKKVK